MMEIEDFVVSLRHRGSVIKESFANYALSPGVRPHIEGEASVWEAEAANRLAADGQVDCPRQGSWRAMGSLRDRLYGCELWNGGKAPCKRG